MADTPTLPAQLPPSAVHPDQPLPAQSTCTVTPDGRFLVVVAVERPCCC